MCSSDLGKPTGVDQLHMALVPFGRLAQHLEDAPGARGSLDQGVHLLADLCDRPREILVQREEGHQRPKRHAEVPGQGHHCAEPCAEDVGDVPDIGVDRHHDVGVPVRRRAALPEPFVELPEPPC